MASDFDFVDLEEEVKEDDDFAPPAVRGALVEVDAPKMMREQKERWRSCKRVLGCVVDAETYRPILATLLLILNVISYKEDPTSYSWTRFKNPIAGYVYNHVFTKYAESYAIGGRWLAFKIVMLTVYPLTIAIIVEFFFRRLILWRLLRCSGFKRDKGGMVVFLISILFGLYTGALLFNAAVMNVEYLGDLNSASRAIRDYYTDIGVDDYYDAEALEWSLNASYVLSRVPRECKFNESAINRTIDIMNEMIRISRDDPKNVRFDLIYCGLRSDARFGNASSSDAFFEAVDRLDAGYNKDLDRLRENTKVSVEDADCLRRLLMILGVRIETNDLKFETNGYCYYLWTNVLSIDDGDVYVNASKTGNDIVNDTENDAFVDALLLNKDIVWLSEGLFNRISSLATFLCDAWTLFAIVDEFLQKRGKTRYLARRATDSKRGVGTRREICDWFNVRVQLFWVYLCIVMVLSVAHVSASVNYHAYGHRCQDLSYDDFDTNVSFNTMFVNYYDGRTEPANAYDERYVSKHFNVSHVGYDAMAFYTTYLYVNETNDTIPLTTTNASDDASNRCQNFWNDKHIFGFSKSGRILLSVVILLLDLVLVLFVSDFPTFQNDAKIYNKALYLQPTELPYQKNISASEQLLRQRYATTIDFLKQKSRTYADTRNILCRIPDICCVRDECLGENTTCCGCPGGEDDEAEEYKAYFAPFIPGLTTTDVYFPSLGDVFTWCCGCCRKSTSPVAVNGEEDEKVVHFDVRKTKCCFNVVSDVLCCRPSYTARRSDHIERLRRRRRSSDFDDLFGESLEEDDSENTSSANDNNNEYDDDDDGNRCTVVKNTVDDKMRLLCCFCCYESCAKRKKTRSGTKKTAITAKWLIYGALLIATTLNTIALIQQCVFEPVAFDQIETTDGAIHQLKNEAVEEGNSTNGNLSNTTNLCMVCPKSIRKKSDPLDADVETWYPMFETVEWLDLKAVSDFGDITKAYTESKMDFVGSCFIAFGENLWISETNLCDSWNEESDMAPEFKRYQTFEVGDDVCVMKKKIKWKCGCSGYHEHEKKTSKQRDVSYQNGTMAVDDDGESVLLKPAFAQRDCNFDTTRGINAFWNGKNALEEGGGPLKDKRWYFDISPKKEKDTCIRPTYCLKMDVLEWLEVVCDQKPINGGSANDTRFAEKLNAKYDIAQLEPVRNYLFYNYDFDCLSCASKSMKHPSYLEQFENAPTFNYAENAWGLESSNVFKQRYFWVGDISNHGDWYENYFYPKNLEYYRNGTGVNAFGIRKSSVSCKITTCPIGSYNTYNDERNVETALYTTIVPAIVAGYMLWIAIFNHCTEIGFKGLYRMFPETNGCAGEYDDDNDDLDRFNTFKQRYEENPTKTKKMLVFYKIVIRLGLCMSCKWRSSQRTPIQKKHYA